ncbi:MAG: L-seryl-tRNA(Sec) selenium transferase, partial [Chloroflexota bacterium]|nr:L-seryl-tRNA(Sec) selenium transferase [Chloroflexota bacterium]
MQESLRRLPSVDALISQPPLQTLLQNYPHELLVSLARARLDEARRTIQAGAAAPSPESLVEEVRARAMALGRPSLRPIINATGVILHTNLGRAPLSATALEAAAEAARGYSNLEFDLASGERGSRQQHVESLLCRLTGSESALVVNNNAAAVLLGLIALARGKEVIVSRGQ